MDVSFLAQQDERRTKEMKTYTLTTPTLTPSLPPTISPGRISFPVHESVILKKTFGPAEFFARIRNLKREVDDMDGLKRRGWEDRLVWEYWGC
jgi:hypothetical protein